MSESESAPREPLSPQQQPENQEKWKEVSCTEAAAAKNLVKDFLQLLQETEDIEEAAGSPQATGSGFRVQKPVKRGPREAKNTDLTRAATKASIISVEDCISEAGDCLHNLNQARNQRWAPFKVCVWRLELRDRRPVSELFRDHAQEALENEKQVLNKSRQDVANLATQVKQMIKELETVRGKLYNSMVVKKPVNMQSHLGAPPKEVQKVDSATLIKDAYQLTEGTSAFCRKATNALHRSNKECSRVTKSSKESLQKRELETEELMRRLDEQMAETDTAIEQAEQMLIRTTRKIHISHEVGTPLEQKVQAGNDMLVQLRASRKSLEEDIWRKTISLRIDLACIKVRPEDTANKPAKVQVPPEKISKPMRKAASTGALRRGDAEDPPGTPGDAPAGGWRQTGDSSALKAGGASVMGSTSASTLPGSAPASA